METRITVIGAGIAGLSCAFDLARSGDDVTVLDAGDAPGGVMGTLRLGAFQFETGPNSIPASAAAFTELCEDAGLTGELVASEAAAETRFLFAGGRLRPLPVKPGQLLTSPLLSWRAKLKLMTESRRPWKPDPRDDDPSFEAFLTERFGREIATRFGGSFVRGIYASESRELGTASAFPRLMKLVREHGSILRGLRAARRSGGVRGTHLLSLKRGLGQLPETLAASLGDRVRLGTRAESLARHGDGWRVELAGGGSLRSEEVVLATPAKPTERLLAGAGLDGAARSALTGVSHASVRVAHLGFERDALPDGFGFLVPPDASGPDVPRALGVLFVSKMFPGRAPAGGGAVSAIYRDGELEGRSDAEVVEVARRDLALALPDRQLDAPAVQCVQRWPDAIPRYAPGHAARMEALHAGVRAQLPGLHLIGTFTGGVSIDDRIRCGRTCATALSTPSPREGVA